MRFCEVVSNNMETLQNDKRGNKGFGVRSQKLGKKSFNWIQEYIFIPYLGKKNLLTYLFQDSFILN